MSDEMTKTTMGYDSPPWVDQSISLPILTPRAMRRLSAKETSISSWSLNQFFRDKGGWKPPEIMVIIWVGAAHIGQRMALLNVSSLVLRQ